MSASTSRQIIAFLVFDGMDVLDFTGPFEVFTLADELHGQATFNCVLVAASPGTVRARGGLKLVPDFTFENCPQPDVLVIPGGAGTRPLLNQPSLLEWLRVKARRAQIVMSVCTGALVLAKAGLLDGLRCTTHHASLDRLAELAPSSTVDPSRRFHDNGQVLTSAGISAGIDRSLHVVSRLLGPEVAAATARQMEYSGP